MRSCPVSPVLLRIALGLGLCVLDAGCWSRGGAGAERGPLDFTGIEEGGDGDMDSATRGDLPPGADLRGGGGDLRGADVDLRAAADLGSGRPPCQNGAGFTAFRFHYEAGSTSARLDAFGLPDNSNWEAVPAFATSVVDLANGGGLNVAGGNWILIRFSLDGLTRINGATLSMRGRSYSVGSSGSFEGWSPIHGSVLSPMNSVSNAWPYRWTSVDYSANVAVGDAKGLTGIRFYPRGGSSNLVVNAIELCIDGG